MSLTSQPFNRGSMVTDDIEGVLSTIKEIRDLATDKASSLYEMDPENNGRIAQRWADIATMMDQTLLLDAGDDASDIDVEDDFLPDLLHNTTIDAIEKVKDLFLDGEERVSREGHPEKDPWVDRY